MPGAIAVGSEEGISSHKLPLTPALSPNGARVYDVRDSYFRPLSRFRERVG